MKNIEDYLISLVDEGVSDLHFKVGGSPLRRINGTLYNVELPPLTPEDTEDIAVGILGKHMWKRFLENNEIDTSYTIPGHFRFRVSVFWQRSTISIVMRIIPFTIPTLEELHVPPVVRDIAMSQRGLILVTGVTGSGKSSTLAGMINQINLKKRCHIITIEDPIEFLHRDIKASINQREVGVDTGNFVSAFRSALRQDPDVILVGELRDLETMEIALKAAETGHLVLSTLHTTDAKETIGRFIDAFPPFQQKQVRLQLGANLRAVISQRLMERADGTGRALASEIMVVNAAVRELILEPEKIHEVVKNMEEGKSQYGMQTFDQALLEMLDNNLITAEEAIRYSTSPNDFKLKLRLR
jgi:twitching motility protein PilT